MQMQALQRMLTMHTLHSSTQPFRVQVMQQRPQNPSQETPKW